jgi:FMN-dependent oxidoreductase (nitrilotriacetate monooxygenase family)
MTKEIRVNAFVSTSPVHQSPGLWRHPRDTSLAFTDLDHWTDLAEVLERALIDAIFIADSIGVNDVHGGSVDAAIRYGAQVPKLDPFMVVPAMALVTDHLGFGITGNISYEPPYLFARRLTTLDHLTNGRAGWNIVTGHYESGAKAMGHSGLVEHDRRYDIADEFMSLMYSLWETSWEDGAVVADGIYAQPDKVHRIKHAGEYFQLDAIHLAEPSPQRTPVLFQAGTSPRGRAFAATHAECVFLSGPTPQTIAPRIADIRRLAALRGRNPAEVLIFAMATVIVGATEEEAKEKLAEYRRYISTEAAVVIFSGWTGIDFSKYRLDVFTVADPDRVWTLRELAEHNAIGGRGPLFVGSPVQVADAIEAWIDQTGADGLNLSYAVMPESYADFGTYVVPELQRRGRYKHNYAQGVLREKLYGPGRTYLPAAHPGGASRTPDLR